MATSIPSSTTFLPVKPMLWTAARLDPSEFKNCVSLAIEHAGFKAAALTLDTGTWPVSIWVELTASFPVDDPDGHHRGMVLVAREHLVALLDLYEVAFEWDSSEKRVKVMGRGGEVGMKIVAPPKLLKRLRRQQDEENRRDER